MHFQENAAQRSGIVQTEGRWTMLPFISVILPVRDERAMLPRLLDELLRQNYPSDRFEILVVDGGSSDGTADLVRRRFSNKHVHVKVLGNPGIRSSAGRNIGIGAAAGDVILFVDGHCTIPSHNLLEDTAAILAQSGAGCLCRPQPLLAASETHTGEVIAQIRSGHVDREMKSCGFVDPVQGGCAYRREVFSRVGLFDENFDAYEDVEFNTRVRKAGIRAYADPRLAVHYQPRKDVRGLFHQMVRSGRGHVRLLRKHAGSVAKTQFAPIAILPIIVLTFLAWIAFPVRVAELLSIPLASMAAAVVVASLRLGIRYGTDSALRAPWIYSAMYFGLGIGSVMEILKPVRPATVPAALEVVPPLSQAEEIEEVERAA